ncbi:hypothetical protein BpHYR1_047507 [Brachionus plicatilis]|uniref:Uncharacterized protein n=1 Tax=Brachionus plicatilis TaxID=10195 RepID=A0A3M7PP22_BRAPC|nr:hypothetical protein BpHYR1_047507 [Brachionus plicatilis]
MAPGMALPLSNMNFLPFSVVIDAAKCSFYRSRFKESLIDNHILIYLSFCYRKIMLIALSTKNKSTKIKSIKIKKTPITIHCEISYKTSNTKIKNFLNFVLNINLFLGETKYK